MKETDVFNACVRWAKHQLQLKQVEATGESIRNVLGDCIHKIQYVNMGSEDFASVVIPVGVLCMEEEVALFRYMGNKEIHPPPQNFSCAKRKRVNFSFYNHIETIRIANVVVKVIVRCNMDIEVSALLVGSCPGNTKIRKVHFDQGTLNVIGNYRFGCTIKELKLGSAIVLRKDQDHAFEFTFYNRAESEGPVCVVKRSRIVRKGGILQLKLQSNTSFVPLLGFSCSLMVIK